MLKLNVFMMAVLSVLIAGCSSASKDDYQKLVNRTHTQVHQSERAAVQNSKPVMLSLGEYLNTEITIDKPVMKLGDELSNFLVFQTPELDIGSYRLDAGSGCYECLGFRKKTLLPYVKLYDSTLNEVQAIEDMQQGQFGYGVYKQFDVFEKESYLVLIAADNRKMGQTFLATGQAYYNGGAITVPMNVELSPEGNIGIKIEKVE